MPWTKEDQKAARRRYRESHKAKVRASDAKWKAANPEKAAQYQKAFRERNKEALRERRHTPEARAKAAANARRWKQANPDKVAAINARQRERHAPQNTEAHRRAATKYRIKNREKARAANRKRYQEKRDLLLKWFNRRRAENKEHVREIERRSAEKHAETIRKKHREYKKAHPDVGAAYTARRRAGIVGHVGYSAAEIQSLWIKQGKKCAACKAAINGESGHPKRYHIDHVMPLARGGPNEIGNIQLLCRPCNLKKNKMHPDDWAKLHGSLFC